VTGDEWPPKRARSHADWKAYWERQRWDRRWRHNVLNPFLYRIRRRLTAPWRWYRQARWFLQRGRRGWSTRDLWSMDYYIARVCGEMTARLLEVAHGYPCSGHTEGVSVPDCIDPETFEARPCDCKASYDAALKKISAGLLAYADDTDDDLPVQESLEKGDERIRAAQDSLRLLAEWLPTLWD
jgi:hypothetical protein